MARRSACGSKWITALASQSVKRRAEVAHWFAGGRAGVLVSLYGQLLERLRAIQGPWHSVRTPKREPYGMVAVFKDLYGNLWDLLEPSDANRSV